jgi:hypothetical protein
MNNKLLAILLVWFIPIGISEVYSQAKVIDYYDFSRNCNFKARPDRFVINSEEEFREMSDCKLNRFDFHRYTIIGVQGTSPGHFKPKVDLFAYKNDIEKLIIIEVTLSGGTLCETCRVNKPSYSRVIFTDKLNPEYRIQCRLVKDLI